MSIEIVHLRCLIVAAEHGSFRRAAIALNVTQPTLSKRIRELEDWLGIKLFERSTSGAYLTLEGNYFVLGAKRIISELLDMENRAQAGKAGNAGQIQIGFYTSLSNGMLGSILCKFAERHDNVDVVLVEQDRSALIPLLERGAIDVVIVLGDSATNGLAHVELWSERIMIALPRTHTLADRKFVYWTDLKHERFLFSGRDPGPELQDVLLSKLASPGGNPLVKNVKAHTEQLLSLVNRGHGVALVCESSTGNELREIAYREVRDGIGPARLGFAAYWRPDNDSPVLKQFLMLLQAERNVSPPSEASNREAVISTYSQ